MNYLLGYYWIIHHKGDEHPSIARLGKRGWEHMYSKHSTKMVLNANKPYKVLFRILDPIMESENDES